jgi:hypothetical protein
MHLVGLDDGSSELFAKLSEARLVTSAGEPMEFPWQGIDVKGTAWQASMAAPQWRAHLLEQARWIMEILQPDAVVIDETFASLGYDEHPQRRCPLSAHSSRRHRHTPPAAGVASEEACRYRHAFRHDTRRRMKSSVNCQFLIQPPATQPMFGLWLLTREYFYK